MKPAGWRTELAYRLRARWRALLCRRYAVEAWLEEHRLIRPHQDAPDPWLLAEQRRALAESRWGPRTPGRTDLEIINNLLADPRTFAHRKESIP